MKPTFSAGAVIGQKVYFSDSIINALIVGDLLTGECSYLDKFPGEESNISHLHRNALFHNGRIIFAPDRGRYVHIYDVDNKEIKAIKVFRSSDTEYVFSNSVIDGDDLWVFPGNTEQPILKVNLLSGKEERYNTLGTAIGDEKSGQSCAVLNVIRCGKKIYAPIFGTSSMVIVDTETGKITVKAVPIENMFFVFLINNKKWITTRDSIYEWNDDSNDCVGYNIEGSIVEPIIFPGNTNEVLLTSAIGGEVYHLNHDVFSLNPKLFLEKTSTYTIGFTYEEYINTESGTLIVPPYGKKCVVYEDGRFREIPLLLDEESWNQDVLNSIKARISEEIMYEGTYIELNEFLKLI